MSARRWWAALAVLLWVTALLAPATSALAMEGERARMTIELPASGSHFHL